MIAEAAPALIGEFDTQFCVECPTDMPEHRATGQWVRVRGHEHALPIVRPAVHLSDSTPGAQLWHASLSVMTGNGWLGAKEFPTQAEAMDYAANTLAQLAGDYQAEAARTPDLSTGEKL